MDSYRPKIYYKNQVGFTLVELIITLVIAGILLTIAVPSFNSFLMNSRLTTQINELVSAIQLSRSEAIKRGTNVTICKSSTGTSCGASWTNGWVVFEDANNNGAVDVSEPIVRIHGELRGLNTLTFGTKSRVTYTNQGLASGYDETFVLCDSRGASSAKAATISSIGRVRLATDSNTDGIVENGSGNNVTCP